MKFNYYLIPLLAMSASCFGQFAGQESSFDRQLRNRDDQALKDFVESKENIDVKMKAENLEVSGDVRFEYQKLSEKGVVLHEKEVSSHSSSTNLGSGEPYKAPKPLHSTYRQLRDHPGISGVPLSSNNLDIEFNLKVKYKKDDAWCYAHLQFDNPAGIRAPFDCIRPYPIFNRSGTKVLDSLIVKTSDGMKGSGFAGAINLKRALLGQKLWEEGKSRVDLQFGRWKFDDEFTSEVEFSNRFDGVLLKYSTDDYEDYSGIYLNLGSFMIDQSVNHLGFIGEVGFTDILGSGLDVRYSLVDWLNHRRSRCGKKNALGYYFLNSQISFSYYLRPMIREDYELPIEIYAGFLVNHAAKRTRFTLHKKENLAGYAGITFGEVRKKGDWSFDIEYVYIEAQAVPDEDVGSIGRGNIMKEAFFDSLATTYSILEEEGLYGKSLSSYSGSAPKDSIEIPRRGNGNFAGLRLEFLYGLTDNLTIDVIYEFSNEINRRLGGRHSYSDFEMEMIYAF